MAETSPNRMAAAIRCDIHFSFGVRRLVAALEYADLSAFLDHRLLVKAQSLDARRKAVTSHRTPKSRLQPHSPHQVREARIRAQVVESLIDFEPTDYQVMLCY